MMHNGGAITSSVTVNQTATSHFVPPPVTDRAALVAEINVSCRLPLVVLFLSAAVWLLVSSAFALIASIKFHSPSFLADPAWLTYGRVSPASRTALLYGFCLQAGLGVGLWLLARLGVALLAQRWLITVGAAFWNLGVTIGFVGILIGDRTGFPSADLPGYATPLLCIGYLLIALGAALTFHRRRDPHLFVSQWYLFTALFWFAWIFSTAQLLLVTFPVRGITQSVIAWWYADNLRIVWFWLVGLATVFYLVPKLTRRDLHSRYLALFTYWMLILFGSWGGIANSAPVPAWMSSLSSVGTVLTAIPLLAVAVSVWQTLRSSTGSAGIPAGRADRSTDAGKDAGAPSQLGGVALRFILFGVVALLVAGFMRVFGALPGVSRVTDLTWYPAAWQQLNDYGFFVMVSLGAIYYIMPQLMGLEFPFPRLVRAHFWLAALGIALAAVPLALAGLIEGSQLPNTNIAFTAIMKATLPFLRVSTVGELLMVVGHVLLLLNLVALVFKFYRVPAVSAYATATADLFQPAEVRL